MSLLHSIKNIFAKKQNVDDDLKNFPAVIKDIKDLPAVITNDEPKKTYSLEQLIYLTYDRDGYQREFALIQLISDFPHHQETLNVLLRLQNDYVEVVRTLAYEYLLLWINVDNLPLLLENTHKFLHLQNQSRTKTDIIDKLQALYFEKNNLQEVLTFLQKHQGKAVRAIFSLVKNSANLADKKLEIALSSPDIVINMQVYDDIQKMKLDKQLNLLNLQTTPKIKNRQFYFKLLLNIINNQQIEVWQKTVLQYLRCATNSQQNTLLFFLNKGGMDFWQVVKYWIKEFDEKQASILAINFIRKNQLTDELTEVLTKYPQWFDWHAEQLFTSLLILTPENPQIKQLYTKYKQVLNFSEDNKIYILNKVKFYTLEDFYHYQKMLNLSDYQLIEYSDKLPLWEQFIFVLELLDKQKINKNNAILVKVKNKMKERALIRDKTMKQSQREYIINFFNKSDYHEYFANIEQELAWFELI